MKDEIILLDDVLRAAPGEIVDEWLSETTTGSARAAPLTAAGRAEAQRTLRLLHEAVRSDGDADNFEAPVWDPLRGALEELSRGRAAQGVSAESTSNFVLALKRPLFQRLQKLVDTAPARVIAAVWTVSVLVDRMAAFTMAVFQRTREDIIVRQQEELLELSTPVVKLWDGVLAVPMIGTLDSNRTQLVMEALLQRIVDTGSTLAIIDITGVPTVDTLVAQHLLKTVSAIRLMGADCIVSGIRPQIAQTIVQLGIDLGGITTKATLADALALAIRRTGYTIARTAP